MKTMALISMCTVLAAAVGPGAFAAAPEYPKLLQGPIALPDAWSPPTVADGFTTAVVGDLLGPGLPQTPLANQDFQAVTRILQAADFGFANQEGSIFDFRTFAGYPAAQNGGGDPLSDASVAADLRKMGISVVSKANNHATDWGFWGLEKSETALHAAGVATAGSGRNLFEAQAPAFLETPGGIVSVLATASTFNPASRAGVAEGELPGRPGISVLRTDRIVLVTRAKMTVLREIAAEHGEASAGDVTIFGQTFREAKADGLTYEMNPFDEAGILKAVRGAKEVSDFALFSIHAHETASGRIDDAAPPDFLEKFLHEVVDAGADEVAVTGQHVLRGIEIYRGKPIFYGLGSFFYELELDRAPPNRETFEELNMDPEKVTYLEYLRDRFQPAVEELQSVVAVTRWKAGKLDEIKLYPLDLSPIRNGKFYGIPHLANPMVSGAILKRLQEMSRRYGTHIDIDGSVGYIRP
jgi:poly-gamma-glutamate capsule biosynthesis protein CapA/YwtB (metallophosphatase superfamily)